MIISGGGTNRVFEVVAGSDGHARRRNDRKRQRQIGGGILNDGTLTLNSTTVANNTASGNGGGVENDGTLTVVDSTITGNSARGSGGGIDNTSSLELQSSTIAANSAAAGGGVSTTTGDLVSLVDTIIATNTAANGDSDVDGTLDSQGNNLIGDSKGASGLTARDLVGLNPDLGPLENKADQPRPWPCLPAARPSMREPPLPLCRRTNAGCRESSTGRVDIGAFELQVTSPTADAGDAYTIHAGDSLTLNASDSTDPNGAATHLLLGHEW